MAADGTSRGKALAVPSSRMARLARLGGMASGIAGGMAVDGVREVSRGRRPSMRDLLLTPANVSRVADQLARMRGAAMKIGQLMSMDAGELMPRELSDILARLRADADYMPPKQLRAVLNAEWGRDWLKQFKSFDVRPIAAASIGQVHRAKTRDGRDLAIKIQYPGVRESIDSDVTNVATLIRISGLIPDGMDIAPLLVEARRQLKEEADYEREGTYLERFGSLLNDAPEFLVPGLHPDLTTRNALAMSYVPGAAIEAAVSQPQETRDQIMKLLIGLLFRELFEFRLMQTDPNFANYRFDAESRRIVLLDFGAAREFPQTTADRYRTLMIAGIGGSRQDIRDAAMTLGLFDEATRPHHQTEIVKIIDMAFEAFRHDGVFDFGNNHLAARMNEAGRQIGADRDFVHLPPMDVLYLQRKFAGMYLLATRLRARVDLRGCLARYLDHGQAASEQAGRFQIATLSSCP